MAVGKPAPLLRRNAIRAVFDNHLTAVTGRITHLLSQVRTRPVDLPAPPF